MGDASKDKPAPFVPSPERLENNLRLLRVRSARAAETIRAATVPTDLALCVAPDGGLTGTLGGRQLASLRAPLAEGETFAQSIDIASNAAVIIRGFGIGHHVAAIARRLKHHGAVVVFEPNAGLLRAVMERLDCPWLMQANLAIVTDPDDTGAIAAAASGIEGILAAGTTLIDHPASKGRLGETSERFGASFTTVMKAVRTGVVTTLVQVDVTLRNLLQNLPWYATVPGIEDLAGACKGKPAVVVSAGPSLRRNIDLLLQPGVRDRVVIIAVQTVLKTLLAKGIKPHFVTALDYHEISRRFYEGLTAQDVEGITLVVEPKCNRAILEAFPGAVRCARDEVLDQVLGQRLARRMGAITPGATVAHLAYYLARHLGCDPVIFIGQDLGFTDGQYYGPGAAIHQVWSSELNEFNTLEMLEWQRIARMRTMLRKVKDTQGRTIYTDEQMAAYLVQFERDFMQDAGRGMTTIDATEGGVLKKHTKVMPLRDALVHNAHAICEVPTTPTALEGGALAEQLQRVRARLSDLRQSTSRIAVLGREAEEVLGQMLAAQQDQRRVNALIERVGGMASKASGEAAYWLVQWLNQTGQFNRFRADRAIHIDPNLSPMEKQKREIERDLVNVRWLADAAEHLGRLLDEAGSTVVRGRASNLNPAAALAHQSQRRSDEVKVAADSKLWVAVHVDAEVGGLGTARDLSRVFVHGMNPLRAMLHRLCRCSRVAGVVLMSAGVDATRSLVGQPPAGLRVEFEQVDGDALRERTRRVGAGRLWARHCWRGGLANLTCYDEAVSLRTLAPVMERRGLDAVACVGADWALVDPSFVDAVIERHLERPEGHELTFVHAPPGLGACVIRQKLARELAAAESPMASIGGIIGFVPQAPQSDPIVKPICISADPAIRDLLVRCIPDSVERERGLAAVLGDAALTASAGDVAAALKDADSPSFGLEAATLHAAGMTKDATLRQLRELSSEVVVTVVDGGGSLPEALRLATLAKDLRFTGVHLRTFLAGGVTDAEHILKVNPDIVSIDVLAERPETYEAITGRSCFDAARDGVSRLLEANVLVAGMPSTWIVPRATRRDIVHEELEDFYIRGLLTAGTCVIDPLPHAIPGERIEPLPRPANVVNRLRTSTLVVDIDGTVRNGAGEIAEAWNAPAVSPRTQARTAS